MALAACALVLSACGRSSEKDYVVGFYNLENLFDTNHDEGKNDNDYLPEGSYKWTSDKYEKKISNMASVIRAMADENGAFHALLGVSEVENDNVLRDLVAQPSIRKAKYKFVHFESPDRRGVDVALLYRSKCFKVIEAEAIPFDFNSEDIEFEYDEAGKSDFRTRDILLVRGKMGGEMFAIFVAHLPSRLGDKGSDLRSRGAQIMHQKSMELMARYPGIKIVAMGDMNDNPTDVSMTDYLRARENISEVGAEDFFSPFLSMIKAGYGTLEYRGVWNIFDIIAVNSNLVNAPEKSLKIKKIEADKFYGKVFNPPFLTQQEGRYKGTPFRTFSRGEFIGGYSDHYPTYIVIGR